MNPPDLTLKQVIHFLDFYFSQLHRGMEFKEQVRGEKNSTKFYHTKTLFEHLLSPSMRNNELLVRGIGQAE